MQLGRAALVALVLLGACSSGSPASQPAEITPPATAGSTTVTSADGTGDVAQKVEITEVIAPDDHAFFEELGTNAFNISMTSTYVLDDMPAIEVTVDFTARLEPPAQRTVRTTKVFESEKWPAAPGEFIREGLTVDQVVYLADGKEWYRSHYRNETIMTFEAQAWISRLLSEGEFVGHEQVLGRDLIHLQTIEDDPDQDFRFEEGSIETLEVEGKFTEGGGLIELRSVASGTWQRFGVAADAVITTELAVTMLGSDVDHIVAPVLASGWEERYAASLLLDLVNLATPTIDDDGATSFPSAEGFQADLDVQRGPGYRAGVELAVLEPTTGPLVPMYAVTDTYQLIVIKVAEGDYMCHATGASLELFPEFGRTSSLVDDYESCAAGAPGFNVYESAGL